MTTEHKTVPISLSLKALSDQGEFEGYALTYGNTDQGGDICLKGCATNSLRKRPPNKVKMLLGHDSSIIIGKWIDFIDDDKGLLGKGRLFLNIQKGRETYELLKEDAIDGLSIGYRTIKDKWDSDRQALLLEEIDVREVSVVPFPMNEQAIVTSVKSFSEAIDGFRTLSDAERFLREVERPLSRKEATEFMSVVRKIVQREAGDDRSAVQALNRLAQFLRS